MVPRRTPIVGSGSRGHIGFGGDQIPIGRSIPNRNRIVQNPIPTRNIARNTTTNHESEERRITKYIEDLNYDELKQELRSRGLSTRGYMRSSFEDRLFNAMRN